LKNKEELYSAYAENTKQVKKVAKEIRHISKYATQLSEVELQTLQNTMYGILKNQKAMIKLIDEKLDLDVWKEINHNKFEKIEEEQ